MDLTTLLGAIAIVALGALQYMLMANSIRDLLRRSRVRGGNKVLWGLVILCLPIAGAMVYGWMGPTSFLSRPQSRPEPRQRSEPETDFGNSRNITPIGHARSVRTAQPQQPPPPPTRIRKTGS